MDWQAEITAAAGRIAPYLRITPVMQTALPGAGQIALKLENTQHTGSFKARGAFNTLVAGPVPKAGVVAASGAITGRRWLLRRGRWAIRPRYLCRNMLAPPRLH